MATIQYVMLDVVDTAAAHALYGTALGLEPRVRLRAATESSTTGFRGFTLSLVASRPGTVDTLMDAAIEAGATIMKPARKSMWGYGGAVPGPDGTLVTLASSSKKDDGSTAREFDEFVLQLGVADVAASKTFYTDHGLEPSRSFGRKYVEFAPPSSPIALAVTRRKALAKTAGVSPNGSGAHELVIGSDVGPFTDPDGFEWERLDQND